MHQRQFEQALQNGRKWTCDTLGAGPFVSSVLRSADRSLRGVDEAQRAWERVASTDWLDYTRVEFLNGRELVISVADPTLRHELGLRATQLAGNLAALVPVIQRVRFVASAGKKRGSVARNRDE